MLYDTISLLFISHKANIFIWYRTRKILKDKQGEVSLTICPSANPAPLCRGNQGNWFHCIHPELRHEFILVVAIYILILRFAFFTEYI